MLGYFALLAMASLIWSAQGTALKFLDRHMGPFAITFVAFYITTLLLVPLLISKRRANPSALKPTWPDWGKFTLAGVVGQVLAQPPAHRSEELFALRRDDVGEESIRIDEAFVLDEVVPTPLAWQGFSFEWELVCANVSGL